LLKLGQQPASVWAARLVALDRPRLRITPTAGELQKVHGRDSPHGEQSLTGLIQGGRFAPDGHRFEDRLHRLFKPGEPLVIALLTQAAVKRDLETLQRLDLMLFPYSSATLTMIEPACAQEPLRDHILIGWVVRRARRPCRSVWRISRTGRTWLALNDCGAEPAAGIGTPADRCPNRLAHCLTGTDCHDEASLVREVRRSSAPPGDTCPELLPASPESMAKPLLASPAGQLWMTSHRPPSATP
jgi:hypothetical protein